jgi:ribokinase
VPRIVVLGSLVFDFVARADRLPRRGESVLASSFGMFTGGKGANQAVQAGRLGAETWMIGRVGQDFLGERLMESLLESGVRTDFVRKDPQLPTGACCIHVDSEGENAIIIAPNASAACDRSDVDRAIDIIRAADVLLLQLETNVEVVAYALERARGGRAIIILNPAPAREIRPDMLRRVDYLTPNESEAEYFSGMSRHDYPREDWCARAGQKLTGLGARNVLITLGKSGAYVADAPSGHLVPGFRVDAVDVTAAGDAFNGAFSVALAEGMERREAVRFANGAGALCASRPGAQASLCNRAELDAFLASRTAEGRGGAA